MPNPELPAKKVFGNGGAPCSNNCCWLGGEPAIPLSRSTASPSPNAEANSLARAAHREWLVNHTRHQQPCR
ncbi:MAG: hypothetical protein R3D34_16355 [Nitratireductor sp.]